MSSGQSRSDAWLLDFPRVRQPARRSLFAIPCFHPTSMFASCRIERRVAVVVKWSPASCLGGGSRDVILCDTQELSRLIMLSKLISTMATTPTTFSTDY